MSSQTTLRASAAAHGRTIVDLLRNALSAARIKQSHEASVAAFLAATIHDAFEAIVILSDSPAQSQIPLLARALMEASADLHNVCGDAMHAKHLHFTSESKAKSLWKDALSLPESNVEPDAREAAAMRVADAEHKMSVLKDQGAKYMRQSDKFKTGNVQPGSYWLYCLLCSPAHNDLSSLVERFGHGELSIRLRALLPDSDYFMALSIGGTVVSNTVALIPTFTDMSRSAVEEFRKPAMEALQAINAAQRDYDK